VSDEKELQQSVQQVVGLVRQLDEISDPAARSSARQLIQVLLELHGAVLERMLEKTFQRGEFGSSLIDEFGSDALVGSVLAFYGLHPQELNTRVIACVEKLRSKYARQGIGIEIAALLADKLHLKVSPGAHTCGSTAAAIKAEIADSIYTVAPDIGSLEISGLDGNDAAGFVSLNKLTQTGESLSPAVAAGRMQE